MIDFIKKYSYQVVRNVIMQVAMVIFALMISFPFAEDGKELYLMLSSVFALIFYLCLIYTTQWDLGFSDSVKIEAGRYEFDKYLGLKISLLANIVNIILGVIILISSFIPSAEALNANSMAIATFIQAYYAGIKTYVFKILLNAYEPAFIYLLMVIPTLIASTLGYIMGVKRKRVLFFLPLPNTKEERNNFR